MAEIYIFKPAKTAMQSGVAGMKAWCAEFSPSAPSRRDPLIGWSGSADPLKQIRLFFDTKEQAIAWAKSKNHHFIVKEPKNRRIKPKSYAANFATDRKKSWTH